MGINPKQLIDQIIKPACICTGLWSPAAGELLLGTACHESHCGNYLRQMPRRPEGPYGPALGIFQMETRTFRDIDENFLKHRPGLKTSLLLLCKEFLPDEMVWNLRFAAAMCRVHYYRVKEPLPAVGNVRAQADYWKQYYNTPLGSGTVEEYLENWRLYAV